MLNDISIFRKLVDNLMYELEGLEDSPIEYWDLDFSEELLEIFVELKSGNSLLISARADKEGFVAMGRNRGEIIGKD